MFRDLLNVPATVMLTFSRGYTQSSSTPSGAQPNYRVVFENGVRHEIWGPMTAGPGEQNEYGNIR